jgi:hypothetical protein
MNRAPLRKVVDRRAETSLHLMAPRALQFIENLECGHQYVWHGFRKQVYPERRRCVYCLRKAQREQQK